MPSPGIGTEADRAATSHRWARRVVVVVQGFTQIPPNGMCETAHRLREQSQDAGQLADSLIILSPWNERAKALAARIDDVLEPGGIIELHAYSWGAGGMARDLVKRLRKRDRIVSRCVLVDPVYRAIVPILRWIAVSKLFARICDIRFPAGSFREAPTIFTQHNDRPTPSPVRIGGGPRLPVHDVSDAVEGHRWMDDSPIVRRAILEAGARSIEEIRT